MDTFIVGDALDPISRYLSHISAMSCTYVSGVHVYHEIYNVHHFMHLLFKV